MTPVPECAVLATVGVVCGVAAHRLAASLTGTIGRQLVLRYFLEGMAIAPGIALVGFFLGQRPVPPNVFQMLRVAGAFIVPYAAARIAAYRSGMARSARRESVLPFVHWFELLRTNPTAANQFLATYLSQRDGERSALLADLTVACAALEQTRPSDSLLPTALNRLRAEIARLELTRGQHQTGRAV